MRKVLLGKTGMQVTAMGFGGIPIQQVGHQEAVQVVRHAYEKGINFYDTARTYTTSEAVIGEALQGSRTEVYLASKTKAREVKTVAADLASTLKNLRTDYLDLYQLHNVVGDEELAALFTPAGVLDFLLKERERGTIRHLGITSHRLETAAKALRETDVFATIQVPFNYIEDGALTGLFPLARELNVGIIAMKPLAGGALNHLEAAVRWCLAHTPGVVIPGVASVAQLEANLAAASSPLTDADLENLEQDKKELGPTFCRRCRYCMPCPNGIEINFILTAELFFRRSGWQRLTRQHIEIFQAGLECQQCGECEQKCPYDLPLTDMVRVAAQRMLARSKELGLVRSD